MAAETKDPIILSFTNKAIEVDKSRIKAELRDRCYTFDSYFCDQHGCGIPSLEGKTTFIEEYSMVPSCWLTKIYQPFAKYKNTVYMYGNTNQCDPVTDRVRIHVDYLTSTPISEMCPRGVELEYIKGCAWYDERTWDMLTKFLQTGSITTKFSPLGQYYTNICYHNAIRRKINKVCCERFVQDKDSHEVHFKYDREIET